MSLVLFALSPLVHAAPPAPMEQSVTIEGERWEEEEELPLGRSVDGPMVRPVVGGTQVPPGVWDDAVGVVMGGYVGCTGTLIAPRVVLTAGHCVGGISDVVIGRKNWTRDGGEMIAVAQTIEYPDSQYTYDVALLILEEASTYAPRQVAMDCILDDYLEVGAPVQIVGFGSTNEAGTNFNVQLMEATSEVTMPACGKSTLDGIVTGCRKNIPGGEIGAGGDGTDACFGDSGGPLYLLTEEGDFVIGATSRGYLGVSPQAPCRDGGIWTRPDAVMGWILEVTGGAEIAFPTCNDLPEPVVPSIVVKPGDTETTVVAVNDPDGSDDAAVVEVVEDPAHGSVSVSGLQITYTADEGYKGVDSFVVLVTDEGTDYEYTGAPRSVEVPVDVSVQKGGLGGGCGCSSAAPLSWTGVLGGLLLVAFRRRR